MPSGKKCDRQATPELESALHQGRLSRREFLTRLSALGLATTLPTLWPSDNAQAKTPKKGGDSGWELPAGQRVTRSTRP